MAIIKQPLLSTKSLTSPGMTAIGLKQNDGSVIVTNAEVTPALLYIVGSVIQPVITIDVNTSVGVLSSTFNIIAPTVTATSPTITSNTKLYLPLNSVTNGATTVNGALEVLDSGATGHVVTQVATAKLSIAEKKFGVTSLDITTAEDYISVPDHANWDFGTGDFCIEGWFYLTVAGSGVRELINSNTSAGSDGFRIVRNDTTFYFYAMYSGSWTMSASSSTNMTEGQWEHVAVTRTGSTLKLFLNGVDVTASSSGGNTSITNSRAILFGIESGAAGGRSARAYMDEIRISNAVRYTANFTPSTTAFTSDSNTLLLLHMDTQDLSSLGGNTPHIPDFIGTAQLSTAQTALVGDGTSLLLDGNSDYITIPDSADWDILASTSQDYTIDFRIYFNSVTGWQTILSQTQTTATDFWQIAHLGGTGWYFSMEAGGVNTLGNIGPGTAVVAGGWHHFAFIKKTSAGPTVEYGIYVDGTQLVYKSSTVTANYAGALWCGAGDINSTLYYTNANMSHVRIQASNIFNASPNVGKTDTIVVPTEPYSA